MSHRFVRLCETAGLPQAALHRFRHSVATSLVEDGKILKAQARLGHRDPSTTLRHYAHATPLDGLDIADGIDRRVNDATGIAGSALSGRVACSDLAADRSAIAAVRQVSLSSASM